MARALSAFIERVRQYGWAEVIPLLELTLYYNKYSAFPGSTVIRLSNLDRSNVLGEEWLGALADIGSFVHGLDQGGGMDIVVANNVPMGGRARFSDLIRHGLNDSVGAYDFHYADAKLFLLFAGGTAGDQFQLSRLVGEEVTEVTQTQAVLHFSGPELLLDLQDGAATFRQLNPARWLTCGFEENDTSLGFTGGNPWNLASGTANLSFVTTPIRSGSRALQVAATAAGGGLGFQLGTGIVPTTGHIYTRFYARWAANPSGGAALLHRQRGAGDQERAGIVIETDGKVSFVLGGSGVTSAGSLPVNTWHRFELRNLLGSAGDGELVLRVYVEDSLIALFPPLFQLTLNGITTADAKKFWFGPFNSTTTWTVQLDDIALEHFTALQVHDFIGPGRIVLVNPAVQIGVAGWTGVGGSPNPTLVDDVPGAPDDATTYVVATSQSVEERYGISTLPAGLPATAFIRLVHLWARFASNVAGAGQNFALALWDHDGRQSLGPSIDAGGTEWKGAGEHQAFAAKLAGRSKAQVQDHHIGLKRQSGANERRVTALWANVEYRDDGAI